MHESYTIPKELIRCGQCSSWGGPELSAFAPRRGLVAVRQCLFAGCEGKAPFADVEGPEGFVFTQEASRCHAFNPVSDLVDALVAEQNCPPPARAGQDYPGSLGG